MCDDLWVVNLVSSGKQSFGGQSLHRLGDTPNPYEQAISIIGKTLAPFDEDNLIPCFGFGDGELIENTANGRDNANFV